MAGYDDDLRFAHVLADAADDITTRRFRALDLRVEAKPDLTPVTDADKAAEESLRNVLRRSRPRDAVLGEEFGRDGGGPRCWVIDPIDGTKNYVRGVPVWATLIGLMDGDQVVMGVVSAPALGRRWWAASDNGAWTGKSLTKATRCRVSDVARMEDASFSYSSLTGWEEKGVLPGFLDLARSVWRTRAYGDFWSHVLVAEGAVDISAEPTCRCGISRRCRSSWKRRVACSPTWMGSPGQTPAAWSAPTRGCTRRCSIAWLAPDHDLMCIFA